MTGNDSTKRFSGRADSYAKGRPGYPEELLRFLLSRKVIWKGASIADIGSGTGIFTKQLLDHGIEVYAVEPNNDMRAEAESRLSIFPKFHSISGRAERTTLGDESVDAITAAQSFHWFNPEPTRLEFRRIIRPGGFMILIWNVRMDGFPFNNGYAEIVRKYGKEHREIERLKDPDRLFDGIHYERMSFQHEKEFDLEGLVQLAGSVSYLPKTGENGRTEMVKDLRDLFDKYQSSGKVAIKYQTICCYGQL